MASKSLSERSSVPLLQLSLSDQLLSSTISLPPNPSIAYAKFSPDLTAILRPHESIEVARRLILERNASTLLLGSLLTSVHIGAASFIYVFIITSESDSSEATSTLSQLILDGLFVTEVSSFTPRELYPCSADCSLLPGPCPRCLDAPMALATTPGSILPRKPLRNVYGHFLESIRIRVLSDIASTSCGKPQRQVKRLKGGFLLGSLQSTNEWGSSYAVARPLVYCQLQIHLTRNHTPCLIIHPLLTQTSFLPLTISLPLSPGTPITLLPNATPAFFLVEYTGPTSALIKQFKESLQGMGVDGWDHPGAPVTESRSSPVKSSSNEYTSQKPGFVIAWIGVENKQGEDKGMFIIYPSSLCLSSVPLSLTRPPLSYIPELPAPLQPSPHVPSVSPSAMVSRHHSRSNTPLPAPIPILSATASVPLAAFTATPPFPSRPLLPSSPTSDSLRTFRNLTLSKSRDVRLVASEVGGYVDAIARERERERERLKRERESTGAGSSSASPRLARTTPVTPAPTSVPTISTPLVNTPILVDGPSVSTTQNNVPSAVAATGGLSNTLAVPIQNFYPSPPQTILPNVVAAQTSPSVPNEVSPVPAATAEATSSVSPTVPMPNPNPSYDPFGNIDSTWQSQPGASWSESQAPYLGMDMGMDFDDMGFGINMGMTMSGSRSGAGTYNAGGNNMDYEDAFTDDDFSFFDRPSRVTPAAPPPPAPPPIMGAGRGASSLTPSGSSVPLGTPSPLFNEAHLTGHSSLHQAGTPQTHPHLSSAWVPGMLSEGFTPRYTDDGSTLIPPDLLPPSPGQTPSSHSAPATPSVHIDHDPATIRRPNTGSGTWSNSIFDPIPFSSYHRVADGKYANGKFSLPSPPDEEDRTEPLQLTSKFFPTFATSSTTPASDWRSKYLAATDPRIGVVRKLKRKMTFEQGGRELVRSSSSTKLSPAWMREREEWELSTTDQAMKDEDTKSDPESEEDDDFADVESPVVSRPSTPPPVYLPLGPTLLQTQFQHSYLLPLSVPLRPPGAAVAATNIIPMAPLTSVPTPVSPAATMGAATEKSKSLEAAAFTVATEVVENSLWADAWCTTPGPRVLTEVWPADVKAIDTILKAVPGLEGPLDIGTLFDATQRAPDGTVKPLKISEPPQISIGKTSAILDLAPTSIRFWEKLGLGPKGGKKSGTSFVLFEPGDEVRDQQIDNWLTSVVTRYEGLHLGTLRPGQSSHCSKDGLVPIRFDQTFRKSLAAFVASLPATEGSLVFFVVTPIPTMTLASPILRQVFSAVKKALKTYSEARVLFQLIPERLIFGSMNNPSSNFSEVEILCASIYNRILVAVDRTMSRRFSEHGERVRKYIQEPAVTIARPPNPKVTYNNVPRAALDVLDRHTFIHVGYQVSPCGKWILAACIDQRGEGHDLGVWLTQTPGEDDSDGDVSDEMFLAKKVWDFAVQFAKRADVEWRLVISKHGAMDENEVDAWTTHLDTRMPARRELPKVHVTLVSAEPAAPWTFLPFSAKPKPVVKHKPAQPSRSSSSSIPKHQQSSTFTDISSMVYSLPPRTHLPEFLAPPSTELGLSLSYIPEFICPPPNSTEDPSPHPLPLHPHSSTTLIRVPNSLSTTSISMLHIHLLHIFPSLSSPAPPPTPKEISQLHIEITRSFYELSVLADTRWNLRANPLLPFHLAAVEAMRIALDRDRGSMDTTDT
ncbi:mediator complex subunit 13 C-terminal-domain-containing protein [Collybia nuda]|uniref:Mediator of RNA polymerase II transcription subunit 13 n=1 Tax=Collybia nuda TaxID=64659 RepID=A0A9P5XYF5_9AGAR|nr:mediator complex subunit 13 C-terminal-domain-containing protein [Collybia nuda]